ncbi:uncharacterized protein LOC120692956 [Panicum virgatum]|uniref:uncharacterized protein LOC120692956 n=1 Tax=Panicum virgatum TaxID=38727 RepID=UPI0019D59C2D|nr:uncharacterized protein LOC120692956 [Panicum virgatum]XP_039832281.1 uncharacterized protein LOC120692956 [Panicum virgatum]XP_039832282.1 uncharacterized protein LOC120692956 [Panicum virgatum]XP_039832283.1 uncharacterized protein LOC120692956 [Panicum virgatum]
MTISRGRTRSRSSNSSVAGENTTLSNNESADPPAIDEEPEESYLQGSAELPPAIPNMQDRPLIEPVGKSHWTEVKGRTPASVLTCLLKHYHPGLVTYRRKTLVATTWKHFQAAKYSAGKSVADTVIEGFLERFRFNLAKEDESREVVGACCSDLLGSIMYYARITATMDHFRIVEGRKICDKIAGQFYLTREEYKQDCWDALATEWTSPEFKERSKKNCQNRLSRRFKPHRGGSNSIAVMRQKMSKKLGRVVYELEAWVHTVSISKFAKLYGECCFAYWYASHKCSF